MKIGLFFGSFNPIHVGHLIIANYMAECTDLKQVWFVISPQNPLKKKSTLLDEYQRLYLVNTAIEDNFNLRATDIEFKMPRPSYTVDTLAYLSEKYLQHEFALIMGEDNLATLHKWKNYEQILENHEICVYPRHEKAAESSGLENHPKIRHFDVPLMHISSSFIRQMVRDKKSIKYIVPEKIRQEVESLYASL